MITKSTISKPPVIPPGVTTTPGSGDNSEKPDMYYVAIMLKAAQENGLIIEVTVSFGEYRSTGDDVKTAASMALYDWDIPVTFI